MSTIEALRSLLGEWRGEGRGGYPTLEPFTFSETFIARPAAASSFITYEQVTDLVDDEGGVLRPSHREAGVIRLAEDGSVELVCMQSGGRLEILRSNPGSTVLDGSRLSFDFASFQVANDRRVLNSARSWRLIPEQFSYEMWMATTEVPDSRLHLSAELTRRSP